MRAYQIEMLDKSLKHNAIVAMDTGSGKTQVAVLRIKKELETCDATKIIWFIATTVALCEQQHDVLKLQIPAVPMMTLAGNSNVDTWGPDIWKTLLEKVRVVISTPQILLDALDHAYLNMDILALLVFDEVHNCIGKSPGGKIMLNHYHPHKAAGNSVPAILGLTATPSIQSERQDLDALEWLMDARCVSPTLHRDELLKCVKRPKIKHVIYFPGEEDFMTPTMRDLDRVYRELDIREDPYILMLRNDLSDRNKRSLVKALEKYDTYTQNHMKSFCARSREVCRQLGPWVADLYIWKAISSYLENMDKKKDGVDEYGNKWSSGPPTSYLEKKHLADIYRRVKVQPPPEVPQAFDDISDKVGRLLTELLSIEEATVGIIFVQERVMVAMLAEVLSINQAVTSRYRIGTMVGTSKHAARKKAVHEFDQKTDYKDLQSFRSGKINLLIATSVLEEGIDVPACNLVICFDEPTTPKAFIQRRGRARSKDSRLVLFFDHANPAIQQWQAREEEMNKIFEDEERAARELSRLEDSEGPSSMFFIVPSTGARLEFDNAKQHLEHFCRVLCPSDYVDSRPDYIIQNEGDSYLKATVLLPPFLPVKLRQHTSASPWRSEKNATKDAAYQAYLALYDAKLVNDNLLPLKSSDMLSGLDKRVSEVPVEPLMKPWHHVAPAWREAGDKWLYSVSCVEEDGRVSAEYEILLPVWLNQPQPLRMFLDRNHIVELRLGAGKPVPHEQVASLPDHTSTLLALHFGHRWPVEQREHVIRVWAKDQSLSMDQIGDVTYDPQNERFNQGEFLIRDNTKAPYLYKDTIAFKPEASQVQNTFYEYDKAPENVPYLVLTKWTRRTDFLHPLQGDPTKNEVSSKPYARVYPLQLATVDSIPARHAQFGMLIPSLIHELGVMLLAKELAHSVLQRIGISDLYLVKEAISARSASEPVNYERLEFLGDSILKFCACMRAAAEKPDYPEGYLSFWRDRLVSNSRLYKAALEFGLPRFMVTKPFTGQKWRPFYLDDVLQEGDGAVPEKRKLSTKTLADVVEALIGASYVDGGLAKAVTCISTFIPEGLWTSVDADRESLYARMPEDEPLPPTLEPLETLIGYKFRKKALLIEALTHASYAADTGKRSLERLEFIGDAVLDNIIVTKLFKLKPALAHFRMHTLKTGLVNGEFLAFMTMEHGVQLAANLVVKDDGSMETPDDVSYLWSFMRHASFPIAIEQKETTKRHAALREQILDAMEKDDHYPWALLAALNPKKFYSDLFEAVLGAVWIDSGSLAACEGMVAQFGILKYMDRLLRDEVRVQHPKEELGMWANTETVTYELEVKDSEQSAGEKEYFCKVFVGKREVVVVRGGVNKEEVKTKGATEALRILREEKRLSTGDVVMVGL
ncbi:P-loop containing nucleoside triphosphate hydrolase protein [Trichoderma citrinoviride]|uniref:P-loop containing nucleoside triphosphate hydrolase protein n=1 Tax=Trichoderma citrinoviride TaxID=58853 RepID=A0A2T4B1B6_9HYPO|nr:P-loop containing nucleoside triphosphate hydrolase protein [Trichoderma citrinoviride]PTB63028.1 P-loop containing nucleoside triphosphate hydrolase protein [Trichoderma citrinoviride]